MDVRSPLQKPGKDLGASPSRYSLLGWYASTTMRVKPQTTMRAELKQQRQAERQRQAELARQRAQREAAERSAPRRSYGPSLG